ncbi:MAG: hypothetical protein B7Y80_17985 [Hyphomicrobium sp. 32-62-53]|nr:MAG: hypothetical protein B7Z29_19215 [Hyphomicrobium sp. 12-62-95]OYX97854.1 MAG: hypothetical protein B7Y80_17985 [Hyphomicrobium sp. 32-62-53]
MTPEALSLYWAGRIEVLRKVLSQPFSATVRSPSLLPAQTVRSQFLSLRHFVAFLSLTRRGRSAGAALAPGRLAPQPCGLKIEL